MGLKMGEEKDGGGISLAPKSTHTRTAENFFPVIVDDFFNDPEALVDFGKSLPKESAPEGAWPGKRSKLFWEIDGTLNNTMIFKILSCYYDLDYIDLSWDTSQVGFQEIPRFSENKNDVKNKGWIHQDDQGKHQLAGLIYLTPDIDPDSGTSLYNVKEIKFRNKNQVHRQKLYKFDHFDREEYTKSYIEHEENFVEKVRFQNIFNRLIMYDTCEWHRANNFYNSDGEDARLTLPFFIGGINVPPIKRIKNSEYDSIIKLSINA